MCKRDQKVHGFLNYRERSAPVACLFQTPEHRTRLEHVARTDSQPTRMTIYAGARRGDWAISFRQ